MIQFLITKDDITKEIECTLQDSISSLKTTIIQEFNLKCKYIDIDFQLERPIRSLGKFNLESGILPRSLDAYKFDRYGLDGKEVTATFHEVNDYEPRKYDKKFKHVNIMKKKGVNKVYGNDEELLFDITSEDDFPSLG
tara:strand:+ start:33 stop:446 length:414 start_codon:yes stop_codon:yes gene_type:complete